MTSRRVAIRFCSFLLAIISLAALSQTAMACPGCKEALASQSGGDIVQGFFWSILFMMAMPFAFVGAFSGYMYLEVRRARAKAAQQSEQPETESIPPVGA